MAQDTADRDVVALVAEAVGDEHLRGTFFINNAREMLRATREIEAAAGDAGAKVYVGFQDSARLDDEAAIYRELAKRAEVIAYGVGSPRVTIDELEWVDVPRDRRALHNQWFLVLDTDDPLAFVGYETSPPKAFRKGPSHNADRTWDGFTTEDQRVVDHLIRRLDAARELAAKRPDRWYLAATDDGEDPRYAAVRGAAIAAAREDGAGVILYDRTTESYIFSPYPSGPWSDEGDAISPAWRMSPGRLDAIGRSYLARQVRDAGEQGVVAQAHLAVDAGAKAMRDAVTRYEPDLVFLPEHLTRPSLYDRVRGNTVEALTRPVDVPVRLVTDEGEVVEHGAG